MKKPDCMQLYLVTSRSTSSPTECEGDFHWVLMLGQDDGDSEIAELHHVAEDLHYKSESIEWPKSKLPMLVRVAIGKIDSKDRGTVHEILADPSHIRFEDVLWNSWKWVEEVIVTLRDRELLQSEGNLWISDIHYFAERCSRTISMAMRPDDMPMTVIYTGSDRLRRTRSESEDIIVLQHLKRP